MTGQEYKNISVKPLTFRRFQVLKARMGKSNTEVIIALLDEYERAAALSKRQADGPKWEEFDGGGVA